MSAQQSKCALRLPVTEEVPVGLLVKEEAPVRLPVKDVLMGSSRVVKQEIVLPCDGDLLGICFGGQVRGG